MTSLTASTSLAEVQQAYETVRADLELATCRSNVRPSL